MGNAGFDRWMMRLLNGSYSRGMFCWVCSICLDGVRVGFFGVAKVVGCCLQSGVPGRHVFLVVRGVLTLYFKV
ncbi:hypothetical protein FRX31_014979 [Thalictrum thalictroides]|uniref:Uncharacterized protein n=1 Tax=Thalictrum thalictroides TaxID=46969 RepID=A0A7J6WDD3_THATH|nr:hypothetical protein FRX31_014979 [Thalictrum thalictroides]